MQKIDIDTPALLLDLAVMENNLQKMADFLAGKSIKLRPHVKTYRAVPMLAQKQLEAGAIGFTCSKLSEAEVLANNGFTDLLIANQIVGAKKINKLINLASKIDIKVAVDNPRNVEELSQAAIASETVIGVLVEVNIGHNRCGVAPFGPALELARLVDGKPGLKFLGLTGYDGHCTLKAPESEREARSLQANTLLIETRKFIEAAGLQVLIVSGSGTFTYRFASKLEGITEIQAGTYLLMDTAFREHGVREFECTLSVLTTIISTPTYPEANGLVIVDTGRKSISTDLGLPEVKFPHGATVRSLSDEHGRLIMTEASTQLQIGDKVELWVRDANGTINQFDRFYCIRNGVVEEVLMIPICGKNT